MCIKECKVDTFARQLYQNCENVIFYIDMKLFSITQYYKADV